jgi:Icc protein
MAKNPLTRRDFLIGSGLTLGAAAMAGCGGGGAIPGRKAASNSGEVRSAGAAAESASPKDDGLRVLRIAHLTDMHVMPQLTATEGLARALRHAQSLTPPPDLILNTGDCIMDGLQATKESALAQWDAFHKVFKAECSLPVVQCIGNHDVWGWGSSDPKIRSDAAYGKGMALQQLELAQRFYSYDQAGWHFIILDSTHPKIIEDSDIPYTGKLDEEQYAWLESDLKATPGETPVCIASHIPFLAGCEYFDGPNEDSGNWIVPGAWMHIDARRMRSLFLENPSVRLCLSGHAHQHERGDYLGVKYLCDGAVSGNWWSGDYMNFPPAYVVVDLYSDGSSDHTFIAYDQV